MFVASQFNAAEKFLEGLSAAEREGLKEICGAIRDAERGLQRKARPFLNTCMTGCQGLCCRNIDLENILGRDDFIYILTLRPGLRRAIRQCLIRESVFSADCMFLENGLGPCLFPDDLRPKVCIMTFCFDDTPIRREIRRVGAGFNKLARFTWGVRARAALGFLLPRRQWDRFG